MSHPLIGLLVVEGGIALMLVISMIVVVRRERVSIFSRKFWL
jgi:hypothetical protein